MKLKTADMPAYLREYRRRRVAEGDCGLCFKPRTGQRKFLCNECAEKHNERQRRKYHERKQHG